MLCLASRVWIIPGLINTVFPKAVLRILLLSVYLYYITDVSSRVHLPASFMGVVNQEQTPWGYTAVCHRDALFSLHVWPSSVGPEDECGKSTDLPASYWLCQRWDQWGLARHDLALAASKPDLEAPLSQLSYFWCFVFIAKLARVHLVICNFDCNLQKYLNVQMPTVYLTPHVEKRDLRKAEIKKKKDC